MSLRDYLICIHRYSQHTIGQLPWIFFPVKAHTTHRQSKHIWIKQTVIKDIYTRNLFCSGQMNKKNTTTLRSFLLWKFSLSICKAIKNEKPLHESSNCRIKSAGKVFSKAIYLLWSRYILSFIERFDEKLTVGVELPIVWLCVHQALVQKKMKNFELIRSLLIGVYFIQGKFWIFN